MNQPIFGNLQTERLNLRPVQYTDQSMVFQGLSDPELTRFLLIHFPTLEATSLQMEHYRTQTISGVAFYWVMEDRVEKTAMGVISLHNISVVHERAEIGFWILPDYQRNGYVREAATALIRSAFVDQGFLRVEASVETGNLASRALLLTLGFRPEGVLRSYEWNRGNRIDLEWFGMIKSDWQNGPA
ncbi:MAG: GNAT family N-acetyltransferase [Bacteroidota bacterium]